MALVLKSNFKILRKLRFLYNKVPLRLQFLLWIVPVLFTCLGFFSLFSFTQESTIPFPLPEVTVNSLGKAVTNIEIPLPPGTGNVVPSLSLKYNSEPTNGILGVGWELDGIEFISRDPSYGIHLDTSDHYTSSSAGPIVLTSTGDPGYYHSKFESFHRFQPITLSECSNGPCSWIEKSPEGITYNYGESASGGTDFHSQIMAEGTNTVKIWALNKVRDLHGNGFDIIYLPETQTDYYTPLPYQIIYNQGATVIEFEYENRSDKESNFGFGGPLRLSKRLSGITVKFQGTTIDEWEFDYDYGSNGQSQLTEIERGNYAPLTFQYFNGDLTFDTGMKASELNFTGQDFNTYYKNSDNTYCASSYNTCLSTVFFGNPFSALMCLLAIKEAAGDCDRGIEKNITLFGDVNGDSIADFARVVPAGFKRPDGVLVNALAQTLGKLKVNLIQKSGSSVSMGVVTLTSDPFLLTEATKILPGDVNGDGKTDFLILEDYDASLKIAYSTGTGFNTVDTGIPLIIPKRDKKRWYYLRPDQKVYQFASDFNGDGRIDFIQYKSKNLQVFFANDSGLSTTPKIIPFAQIGEYGDANQALVDLDGNGIPDLVRFYQIDNSTERRLLFTLFDENQNVILNNTKVFKEDGLYGNFFFADVNGDNLLDYISITSGGNIKISHFDGKDFLPFSSTVYVNGLHYMEDISKYMISSVSEPYLLDLKRDGEPLDKILALDLYERPVLHLYLHDNISQFTQDIAVDMYFDPGVSVGQAATTNYDIDGDGNTEAIYIKTYYDPTQEVNTQVWELNIEYSSDGYHFKHILDQPWLYRNYTGTSSTADNSGMTLSLYKSWKLGKTFTDMNGDNRADLVWFDGDDIRVSYSVMNGDSVYFDPDGDFVVPANSFNAAIDLNLDGRPDLLGIESEMNPVYSFNGYTTINSDTTVSMTGKIQLYYKEFPEPIGILKGIANDIGGKQISINYADAHSLANAIPNASANAYPVLSYNAPDYLVQSVQTNFGEGNTGSTNFSYLNHWFRTGNRDERRNLGFEKITSTSYLNQIELTKTEQYTIQNGTFYTDGIVYRNSNYTRGNLVSDKVSSIVAVNSPFGTKYSRSNGESELVYKGGELLTQKSTSVAYDTYGNPTNIAETVGNYTTTTNNTFQADLGLWLLCKIQSSQKTINGLLVQDRTFSYTNFDLTSIEDFSGKSEYSSQTFQYDSYGNRISIKDTSNREMTIEYDSVVHKFPIKVTNPLGQIIQKEYDLSRGLETKTIDPNGGIRVNKYDVYARPIEVILPGESDWSQRYVYDLTGQPGNTVQMSVLDSENGEVPTKEYYDVLGRSTKKETSLGNGNVLVTSSEYNLDGTLKRKANPYISGIDTTHFTEYEYNGPDGSLSKIIYPDGRTSEIFESGFTKEIVLKSADTEIQREKIVSDERGKVLSKEIQGTQAFSYVYDAAGRLTKITDVASDVTKIYYDLVGRVVKQSDSNSGTTLNQYDTDGKLWKSTDARGVTLTYSYDSLGRVSTVNGGSNSNSIRVFEYDTATNGIGRVAKVTDGSGSTQFEYDIRGNTISTKKQIDDLIFVFRSEYDSLGRPIKLTYPNGSIAHNEYSAGGFLNGVTMDVPDQDSYGFPIVEYIGPSIDETSGEIQVVRKTGNGVETKINIDPIRVRAKEYVTTLPNGTAAESVSFSYDEKGNIISIVDRNRPDRTQSFTFDTYNRLIQATGKYGTEDYSFSPNGNLLKKGTTTYQYTDSNHTQAVTSISLSGGTSKTYSYDASGNMVRRDDSNIYYDEYGKPIQIESGSDLTDFAYDYTGSRVKRTRNTDGSILFSVGDLYEILRKPGKSDVHTLYVKGAKGEIAAQFSRTDSTLVSWNSNQNNSILAIIDNINVSLKELFYKILGDLHRLAFSHSGNFAFSFRLVVLAFGTLMILILSYHRNMRTNFFQNRKWVVSITPFLLICVFSSVGCSGLLPGGESGTPPWLLIPTNIDGDTPSIDVPNPGGGSGSSNGSPATGLYFYQTNHLGSVTMLTDGSGNQISGGSMPGASHVSYKPYGEILRTDSAGPDIFRYKFTGQIEDSDNGLYDYKSRFYDPELGRFLTPDSIASANQSMGMNRYMYVEGNPPNFADPSGHNKWIHRFNNWVKAVVGQDNEQMKRNLRKDIIGAMIDSDNPALSILGQSYLHHDNKKRLRQAQREQMMMTAGAIVLAAASFGAATLLEGSLFWSGAFTWLGSIGMGYAIGSGIGYVAGGFLGAKEGEHGWNSRSALYGAAIGGLIGAAIGNIVGMEMWAEGYATSASAEDVEIGKFLFGDPNGATSFFTETASTPFEPGLIRFLIPTIIKTGIVEYGFMTNSSHAYADGSIYSLSILFNTFLPTVSTIEHIQELEDHYTHLTFSHSRGSN
ncbi:RHS repeat-associated core domain-containing protein [Leptospira sarikeiensis]|uniref:Type IV secretion protein Rhs n=1 Tax=Leptospira sarikeiensis TaxID=2484943 RepID=A0A4R9KDD1_9LEPT|nr:RHS repeat-associated core domain-containing protein [Leptospira sarikeiensis]TGL65959.1 hypothetical protein EHQ64_00090 [Leptospira sarikeiensis]